MIPANQNLSISFFVTLLRTFQITWSIFSLVILKEKQLHIQKHYWDSSRLPLHALVSSFHNPNFSFVVQIPQLLSLKNKVIKFCNIHYLNHSIKVSFNFYLFMFKISHILITQSYSIWFISFSVAFQTKSCKYRLSSSIVLLPFFHWATSHYCDLILLTS